MNRAHSIVAFTFAVVVAATLLAPADAAERKQVVATAECFYPE